MFATTFPSNKGKISLSWLISSWITSSSSSQRVLKKNLDRDHKNSTHYYLVDTYRYWPFLGRKSLNCFRVTGLSPGILIRYGTSSSQNEYTTVVVCSCCDVWGCGDNGCWVDDCGCNNRLFAGIGGGIAELFCGNGGCNWYRFALFINKKKLISQFNLLIFLIWNLPSRIF